jgi:hypothetical protein
LEKVESTKSIHEEQKGRLYLEQQQQAIQLTKQHCDSNQPTTFRFDDGSIDQQRTTHDRMMPKNKEGKNERICSFDLWFVGVQLSNSFVSIRFATLMSDVTKKHNFYTIHSTDGQTLKEGLGLFNVSFIKVKNRTVNFVLAYLPVSTLFL